MDSLSPKTVSFVNTKTVISFWIKNKKERGKKKREV